MTSRSERPRRLEGKVAVVTGGASGIGEATVRTFIAHGAKVVVADIQDAAGLELVRELGGDSVARYVHCDVTNEKQFISALDFCVSTFGGLDILHNNAGILGAIGPIENISADDWDRTSEILVKSYFLGIKHATRIMRAAADIGNGRGGRGGGSIINTASVASVLGGFAPHCYTTCKHALLGLTKSTAAELRSYQIRVNAISPGAVITPMFFKSANSLSGYKPTPSAVATAERVEKPMSKSTEDQYQQQEQQKQRQKVHLSNGYLGHHNRLKQRQHHQEQHGAEETGGLLSSVATAQDVANVALFLASDESRYVSGHNLVVDGSYTAAPERMQLPFFFANTGMVPATVKSEDTSFK